MPSTISDGRAGLASQLPPGLQLGDELFGHQIGADLTEEPAFGRVFRVTDLRLDACVPVARVVRLLKPSTIDETWRAPLVRRVEQLLSRSLQRVAPLHEAGTALDGTLYLITDYYPSRLDQRRGPDGGVDAGLARCMARQLLEGLAALHQAGLVHGDLRPSNIFLNDATENGASPQLWIVDAALGGLAFWSGGARRDPQSTYYRPPSWHGEAREPSVKGDLFALGMTLCEWLVGSRPDPTRRTRGATQDVFINEVPHQLKTAGVPRDLRRLILALISEGPDVPHHAADALKRWQKWERASLRKPFFAATGVLLAVASILTGLFVLSRQSREALQQQLTIQQSSAQEAAAEATRLERKVNELEGSQRQIEDARARATVTVDTQQQRIVQLEAELDRRRAPVPTPPVEARALEFWRTKLPPGQKPNFAQELQALERVITGLLEDDDTKSRLQQWFAILQGQQARAGKWLRYDSELQRRYLRVRSDPTNDPAKEELKNYIGGIDEAKAVWSKWLEDTSVKYEELRVRAEGAESPETRDILKRWLSGFAGTYTYTLQFKSASASTQGLGTSRRLLLYSSGTEYSLGTEAGVHEWATATAHTYSESDLIKFPWEPDQPIRLWLGSEWSVLRAGGRPTLLDQTLTGPLAVWIMYRDGEARQAGAVKIDFKIETCPGPPREMFVDPAKSLPPHPKPAQ